MKFNDGRVSVICFQEMGFPWEEAEQAVQRHSNIEDAVDSLIAGVGMS